MHDKSRARFRSIARSPRAEADPFIRSLQQECTDHIIGCDERHFDCLVREHVEHYLTERPHQRLGNVPVIAPIRSANGPPDGEIVCRT
ncbi:MAG: hypothetical protein U0992_03700 [Planctomycetaceae bacterium]